MAERGDHVLRFFLVEMLGAVAVGGEAHRHRAAIADRAPGFIEQFAHQAHAVIQRAAVLVGALVAAPRQEFRNQVAVARIHVDDIEPRALRTQRSVEVPTAKLADIAPVHAL